MVNLSGVGGYWLDMSNQSLVYAMTGGIGARLTNWAVMAVRSL